MTTDTSERGLERLICAAMAGHPCDPEQLGETLSQMEVGGTGGLVAIPTIMTGAIVLT